jgi:hypothetical protein
MAPATPLTPPSSGSEAPSPLAGRQANVSKKRRSRTSTGKFTWKLHHRRTLLVCYRSKLSSQDIAKVFNKIYSEDCISAGYQDGITPRTLNTQWQEHRKPACKPWQEVLASIEAELEISRAEVQECLDRNPPSTPASRQRPPNGRWGTSTANTRVQTFDAHETTCSTGASVTATHDEDTINVATEPLTPPVSPTLQVQELADLTLKPAQEVSVVADNLTQPSLVTSTRPVRKIFNKSPRTMITAERTRTISGQQVSIIRATDPDLVVENPVTPAEAHSPVPELLFRFYDDHTQGVRTRDGEICGRYAYQPCGPPSPVHCSDDRLFVSALSHLNEEETASELISTTSNFFFAMRLAAKSDANPHIYVIRGSAMPKRKIFHLWPYHKKFKKLRLYYGGKYRNPSSHEYALWATLPRDAIIYDFALADLERHLIGNLYMSSIFRIYEMRTGKSNKKIRDGFADDKLDLTLASIDGIAKLMPQFGITVTSPAPFIARLISEIIRGFAIELPKNTPAQWNMLGGAFAYALSYYANQTHLAETDLVRAKEAFLSGVRSGLGELNWHLSPEKQNRMIKKGLSLGLGVNQIEVDTERLESNKRFRRNIARFSYGEKNVELDPDMIMDEDDTLINEDDDNDDEDEEEEDDDEDDDTLVQSTDQEAVTREHNENEEAATDIEVIAVKAPPESQHSQVSVVIEASQPSNRVNEAIIISDSSDDDEDYIADTDNEDELQTYSNKPAQPEPRLSQQMPSPTPTDTRPRRRSNRRRTQTPPIYNFSRADGVDYITDQSDDENYIDAEVDNDEMEF